MENPDKKTLMDLASHQGENCITIYLPTHRKGHEVNEDHDRILFKNHLQKLRADLQQRGLKSQEVEHLINPMTELLKETEFWKNQREGLAIFRSNDFFEYFPSPIPFEEFSQINNRFLLQPLLPLLNGNTSYHILNLTKHGARLYKASPYSIKEIETGEAFPEGIEEITQYYEFEKQYQGRRTGRGDGNAASRGDTTEVNNEKEHLLEEYFRGVDAGIRQLLHEENTPLVLASVEYYHSIYRHANTYGRLSPEGLTGNFDQAPLVDLHQMANELMQKYFTDDQSKRVERYQNNSATNLTSTDLREILEASVTGRIDTLFLRRNAQVWGKFDENNLQAVIHDTHQENDESLTEKAALITIQNGGEVYVMDDVDLLHNNGHALAAALYRF
jgi:hypothetical protein